MWGPAASSWRDFVLTTVPDPYRELLASEWALAAVAILSSVVIAGAVLMVLRPANATEGATKGSIGRAGGAQGSNGDSEGPWKGWEKSIKRDNSYYYAHNRANDGLKQEDYTMNGPRKLDGTDVKLRSAGEQGRPGAQGTDARKGPSLRGRAIKSYGFCDGSKSVEVYISVGGWDLQTTQVETANTSTSMTGACGCLCMCCCAHAANAVCDAAGRRLVLLE